MGRKKGEIRGLALTLRCVKSNMSCNNNKAGKKVFCSEKESPNCKSLEKYYHT